MKKFMVILISFITIAVAQNVGRDFVELFNGEILYGKIERQNKGFFNGKKNRIIVNDSLRLKFSEVKKFQNEEGYYCNIREINKTRSLFAKRVITGKIDIFESYSVSYNHSPATLNGVGMYGSVGVSTRKVKKYFSKDDGPISLCKNKHLIPALSDNPKALKLIMASQKASNISKGLLFGGFGVTAIGLAISAKDGNVNGFVIGGIVMSVSSWIPHIISGEKQEDAIFEYNKLNF